MTKETIPSPIRINYKPSPERQKKVGSRRKREIEKNDFSKNRRQKIENTHKST